MSAHISFLLLGTLATSLRGQGINDPLPRFDGYAVTQVFHGKPALPKLDLERDRVFRTRIREGAANGPNFAGHYTIAAWGCGSFCVSFALVDAANGTVYAPPFSILGYGDPQQYEAEDSPSKNEANQLVFRLNSRLLVVKGCPEDKSCATYFYEWTGSRFKLIRKVPAWSKYLLPTPVFLSGTVVDENGTPVPDVWVAHAGDGNEHLKTDRLGQFRFRTQVPAVVFRKDGFAGAHYRVQEAHQINVKLKRTIGSLPACNSTSECNSIARWDSVFCFPNIPGISVSAESPGDYYKDRWFDTSGLGKNEGIRHFAGTQSSSGIPSDADVWSSIAYSERTYIYDFVQIVDARGTTVDGKKWRFLGRSDEEASYRNRSSDEAAALDKVLDAVCIRSPQQRR